MSPTRGIIDEMRIADRLSPEAVVVLTPRPGARCGAAEAEWRRLERNGCAALAKSLLCKRCIENVDNGGEIRLGGQARCNASAQAPVSSC